MADGSFPHYDYHYIRTCTTLPELLRIRYPNFVHNPPSVISKCSQSASKGILRLLWETEGTLPFTQKPAPTRRLYPNNPSP